jgi:O-methyltransferase involved in polyketide biosynthesis
VSDSEPLIRNISDTARWAAMYRARESDRPDAVFHDRLARQLAGSRGQEIANAMPFSERQTWAWIARTYLFDEFISKQVAQVPKRDRCSLSLMDGNRSKCERCGRRPRT